MTEIIAVLLLLLGGLMLVRVFRGGLIRGALLVALGLLLLTTRFVAELFASLSSLAVGVALLVLGALVLFRR